ncbi:NFX1-type zinc finger-containing protein 1 [Tribolium castaneum]|uniref:Uncharacterized protein n=1 Tax=Tribolium castaneum TaxID=7070 RepID=A0A139WGZ0_TRICA|nr:PREDICTED: NFX1-type zinc finger-containing protein 1-like [Tribolium castaneum]KYB27121.1 hypothetical protein TcasGA2_TC033318 [Tribolium castaneum]|eukprot:XP_008194512.1 PREDICTED: NFX1-type zinc finger-containing protein 1-like [Tribolium castaneum]
MVLNNDFWHNFRDVSIYPTCEEILGKRNPVDKNIIRGKFHNVGHYLDVQFRLLREDFIANLREGIESYRAKESTKVLDIYENVRIYKDRTRRSEECLKIDINVQEDDSKKFMNGSLLIFTKNNFDQMFQAKVVQRSTEPPQIIIELIDVCPSDLNLSQSYTMAECSQYFDPYFNVLTALKATPVTNFPMERYIVHCDTSARTPPYLSGFAPERWGRSLNRAQMQAFTAALTREFVVIQGPPGTGKTHLGVKIATTLLQNAHLWHKNSPMLVISHKNDALDQFLEGLIPCTSRLIRAGGQSKSEKLKQFNLITGAGEKRRKWVEFLPAMQQSLVVGMTTSVASRWRAEFLEELQSPIVVVEEAAEVLEAHVVAALTSKCQHLILLGDHQQLQPLTADNNIGKNYHLGVSLFERMVLNHIQCYQLDIQHRMRPEIADLLRVRIYPFLKDHESVLNRPGIPGMHKNVFFVDHNQGEETSSLTTKKNTHEARFLVFLARYLILNGHKSSDIVILATYLGQMLEIEKLVKSQTCLEGVKVSTLDGFQGQEAEIVLLSLVRSSHIGFLKAENRICVALSRARSGFYIMGKMALLAGKSQIWNGVKRCLAKQGAIGRKIALVCQKHKTVTQVETIDDFQNVQNGGCHLKCCEIMACGHNCVLLCHTSYLKHKCERKCVTRSTPVVKKYEIGEPDLWSKPRTDGYVRPRDFGANSQLGESESFSFTRIVRNLIRSFVHFIVENFFT